MRESVADALDAGQLRVSTKEDRSVHLACRLDRRGCRARARDRILDSAYELFSTRGVRAVGIDEVIERAAVAKATLYRHFPSKDELVLAFLQQREVVWTHGWVEAEARKRGATPDAQPLAIFDLFDEWFHRAGLRRLLVRQHPARDGEPRASRGSRERRAPREHPHRPRALADEAGLRSTDEFARSFHILMKGSIVQAGEGDVDAAKRAKEMARDLIEKYR